MSVDYRRVDVFSSENRESLPIYPLDVFRTTAKGVGETSAGATRMPAEVVQLLVAIDGKASVGDLEQALPHIPPEMLRTYLRMLISDGMVRPPTVEEDLGLDLTSFFSAPAPAAAPSQGAVASAGNEAERGMPALKADGYYVSIARQSVGARVLGPGESHSVLLIDDDPDFCALVERQLAKAGFVMRVAQDRTQIVAELRKVPLPDLVLLDVNLPGTNGFEILARMKLVPALKTTPVIMTTAEATRASVMKGLVGGADGYITKPFKAENLLKGVKTVLGLA